MIVRSLEIVLHAPWVHSLKEKRMIVRSIIGKLSNHFNISVIESDQQDVHDMIYIGIAMAAAHQNQADSIIDTIIDFVEKNCEASIVRIIRDEYE